MIGRICGIALAWEPPKLLLDVRGIGLEVQVAKADLEQPQIGAEHTLFTHMVIREHDWSLYGFATKKHRDMFRLLIKVNKVGPGIALGLMTHLSMEELCAHIGNKDAAALQAVPGVGKRGAELLIIGMHEHVGKFSDMPVNKKAPGNHQAEKDACAALESLGYGKQEAQEAISKISTGNEDSEALVRKALRTTATG
jgi:Holliday junction DNA helicase RuvA